MNTRTASQALTGEKARALNKMEKYRRFHPSADRFLLPENVAFTAKETKEGVIIWSRTLPVVASVKCVRADPGHQKPEADDGSKALECRWFSRPGRGLEDGSRPYLGRLRSWSQQVANKLLLHICEAVSNSHSIKDSFINTFFPVWSNSRGKVQERGRILKKESLTSWHNLELICPHCFLKAANVAVLLHQEEFDHLCARNLGAAPQWLDISPKPTNCYSFNMAEKQVISRSQIGFAEIICKEWCFPRLHFALKWNRRLFNSTTFMRWINANWKTQMEHFNGLT